MSKLLAIDGLSILRRVFEANQEEDPSRKAELAVTNTFSSFRRLLATHTPSHVLAAFDAGGPTWRHALYPRYKENRPPMPVELRERIPDFLVKLQELGLHPLRIQGVDAEDVIATGSLRWLAEGRGEVVIAGTDKDLHVLIEHGALVWDHFEQAWHDAAWVEKKWGVTPSQLADYLSLMGDSVDGVPGVEGIGKKKAAMLMQTYGTLDAVFSGAGILLNPLGATLRKGKAEAYLSRELIALKTDVKLGVTWKMLAYD